MSHTKSLSTSCLPGVMILMISYVYVQFGQVLAGAPNLFSIKSLNSKLDRTSIAFWRHYNGLGQFLVFGPYSTKTYLDTPKYTQVLSTNLSTCFNNTDHINNLHPKYSSGGAHGAFNYRAQMVD